jgi:hypothetical protein
MSRKVDGLMVDELMGSKLLSQPEFKSVIGQRSSVSEPKISKKFRR